MGEQGRIILGNINSMEYMFDFNLQAPMKCFYANVTLCLRRCAQPTLDSR